MTKLKNILKIDTSKNTETVVGLVIDGKEHTMIEAIDKRTKQKTQPVLKLIDTLLKKHSLTIREIGEIRVNKGPGSFTGLRVGIAIANALAYSLKIPVNGLPLGEFPEPQYE